MPGINYHRGRGRRVSGQSRDQKPNPVLAQDICPGCIVWLGFKEDTGLENIVCVRGGHCDGKVMEDNRYCHPVLVLEVHQRPCSNIEGGLVCMATDVRISFHSISKHADPLAADVLRSHIH